MSSSKTSVSNWTYGNYTTIIVVVIAAMFVGLLALVAANKSSQARAAEVEIVEIGTITSIGVSHGTTVVTTDQDITVVLGTGDFVGRIGERAWFKFRKSDKLAPRSHRGFCSESLRSCLYMGHF